MIKARPFFSPHQEKAAYVSMGHGIPSGFRAIVSGILDLAITHPNKINTSILSKLIEEHVKRTAGSSFEMLGPSELVIQVSGSLQKMASVIEELTITLSHIAGTNKLDGYAIASLSNFFALPITLHVTEDKKELPLTLRFSDLEKNTLHRLTLSRMNDDYRPKINQPSLFQGIPAYFKMNDENAFLSKNKKIQRKTALIETFRLSKQQLLMNASELDLDALRDDYIHSIRLETYDSFQKALLLEGEAKFFDDTPAGVSRGPCSFESMRKEALLEGIARGIALQRIEEDIFEERMTRQLK